MAAPEDHTLGQDLESANDRKLFCFAVCDINDAKDRIYEKYDIYKV